MQVTLIFPPISNCMTAPPASLSALKAYMVSQGLYQVETRDLNVEFIHFLLNHWDDIHSIIEERLQTILSTRNQPEHYKEQITRMFHICLPSMSCLQHRKRDDHTNRLLKILCGIINAYYVGNLLVDDNFLFCDFSELNRTMDGFTTDPIIRSFMQNMSLHEPSLIGFSLLSESQLPYTLLIAKILKMKYPHIKTVAGGPYITEIASQFPEPSGLFSFFDYVVVHEGESALRAIYDNITTNRRVEHPNVLSKSTSLKGEFLMEPIDSLPPQDFQDLNLGSYFNIDISLPVYSSKGCSWGRCMFCSLNSNSYREKSIELFVSDLERISGQTGINHFQFVDENITPARLRLISEAIIARDLAIRWFIQVRFDKHLDFDVLELMKQAGCYAIEFGLESGSPQVLRRIKKGISLVSVEQILADCERLNYQVVINCMVGFPDETIVDAEETVSFLNEIATKFPLLIFKCNTQTVKIYRTCRYAKRTDLNYKLHQLSTVAEWKGPLWLAEFQEKFKEHFIFTGQPIGSRAQENKCVATPLNADPALALSEGCCYIDGVAYDFSKMEEVSEPKSYVIVFHPVLLNTTTYMLNETMDSIMKELVAGELRLSLLRERFTNRYHKYDRNQVASAFSNGVLRLNEIGAIKIW